MPEITLTESQHEQLEAVRADVEDAFVETYGHARLEDAVDYLLDTYTPPNERDSVMVADGYERIATAEYPELQHIAADVPDIPGSGIDADEMRGNCSRNWGRRNSPRAWPMARTRTRWTARGRPPKKRTGMAMPPTRSPRALATTRSRPPTSRRQMQTRTATTPSRQLERRRRIELGRRRGERPLDGEQTAARTRRQVATDRQRRGALRGGPAGRDHRGVRTKDDVRQYLFKNY
ncbi:hypothetical protein ACFQH8_16295 [Halomicroarcula sp. GCM10025710]